MSRLKKTSKFLDNLEVEIERDSKMEVYGTKIKVDATQAIADVERLNKALRENIELRKEAGQNEVVATLEHEVQLLKAKTSVLDAKLSNYYRYQYHSVRAEQINF